MAQIHRAVICLDAAGVARVLATDSAQIAADIEEIGCGTDAGDIGIVSAREVGPGLNLWTGTVTMQPVNHENSEYEPVYKGRLEMILGMVEALRLLAMAPLEPEDNDIESPSV